MSKIVQSIICIEIKIPLPLQIISGLIGHNIQNSDENGGFGIQLIL